MPPAADSTVPLREAVGLGATPPPAVTGVALLDFVPLPLPAGRGGQQAKDTRHGSGRCVGALEAGSHAVEVLKKPGTQLASGEGASSRLAVAK